METVLVLPLLLTILGGVMWLGQLQLNRLRLMQADRYITWQWANRHIGGGGTIPTKSQLETLGFSDSIGENLASSSVRLVGTGKEFWRGVAAGVTLKLEAPVWIEGLLNAVHLLDAEDEDFSSWRIDALQGRPVYPNSDAAPSEASGSYEGHFLLARSPAGGGGYNGVRVQNPELVGSPEKGSGQPPRPEVEWEDVAKERFFK